MCRAGSTPKTMLVIAAMANAIANSFGSMPTSCPRGRMDVPNPSRKIPGASTVGQALHERDPGSADRRAERAARGGEHEALRQDLLHDARAAGADGDSHRHLALPCRAARQQKVRDIGADDEEDDGNGGEQHVKRGPQSLDHSFLDAPHVESRHTDRGSVGGRRHDRAADDIRFFQGGRERDARTQTADQRDPRRSLRGVDDERRVVVHLDRSATRTPPASRQRRSSAAAARAPA